MPFTTHSLLVQPNLGVLGTRRRQQLPLALACRQEVMVLTLAPLTGRGTVPVNHVCKTALLAATTALAAPARQVQVRQLAYGALMAVMAVPKAVLAVVPARPANTTIIAPLLFVIIQFVRTAALLTALVVPPGALALLRAFAAIGFVMARKLPVRVRLIVVLLPLKRAVMVFAVLAKPTPPVRAIALPQALIAMAFAPMVKVL